MSSWIMRFIFLFTKANTLKVRLVHCTSWVLTECVISVSTAPKELREVDMTAKMSKSKKKKLKKRAKRNQALMEETMQHIEQVILVISIAQKNDEVPRTFFLVLL